MPQRYFIEPTDFNKQLILKDDAHHIIKVMRMKENDQIIVCTLGECYLCEITELSLSVSFKVIKQLKKHQTPQLTLIQGIPKGNKTDIVAKYATIFGVSKIVFLEMQRSIAKDKNSQNKIKRLSLIAKEAAELAHRFDVPKVDFVTHIKSIDFSKYDVVLVADENEKTTMLKDVIKTISNELSYAIIIGPEGGITDEERKFFKNINAQFISLGFNILPTEIASIYALTYFSLKNVE